MLNHSIVFLSPLLKPFTPEYFGFQLSIFLALLLLPISLKTSLFFTLTLFLSRTTLKSKPKSCFIIFIISFIEISKLFPILIISPASWSLFKTLVKLSTVSSIKVKSLVGDKFPNLILRLLLNIWVIIVGMIARADCLGPKVLNGLIIVIGRLKDLGIDFKKLEIYLNKISKIKNNRCINKKTGKIISGIIPVHIFGHACDVESLARIAKKFRLKIIEDAAEAVGSFYKKKHLGTFGDVGCLSFNGNKIITTGGGGAVITNKKNIAKKINHLTNTAKIYHKWEYIHDDIGYNFRLPSLNAALGLAQIEKLNTFLNAKRKLFQKYSKNLGKLAGVSIFKEGKNMKSNYWLQTLILDKKNKYLKNQILNYCYKKKIYLRPVWKLISTLKPYKKNQKMDLAGARDIIDRAINLPSSQRIIIKK